VPSPPSERELSAWRTEIDRRLERTDRFTWQDWAEELEFDGELWRAVEVRRAIAARLGDPRQYLFIGDALLEAGLLDEALSAAEVAYRADPELSEAHELIIEVLRRQGRPLEDFSWLVMPEIHRLDERLAQRAVQWLEELEGLGSLTDFWIEDLGRRACAFELSELAAFLAKDSRFRTLPEDHDVYLELASRANDDEE
jgi:tetratricopeptide (TPR) repeat protein